MTDEAEKGLLSPVWPKSIRQISLKKNHTEIENGLPKVGTLEVTIEHVTGKGAIELVKRKED